MNNILKYLRVSINLIENLNLDLSNLNILTECASNAYAFTPIISCLAGAKSVIVVGSDTRYGKYEDNKSNIIKICNMSGLDISKLIFVRRNKLDKIDLSNIDIITNSGQLRPITESLITKLKRTAVIPLMWEPWEFRKEDLNIVACQKKNIPVIGTNENFSALITIQLDYSDNWILEILAFIFVLLETGMKVGLKIFTQFQPLFRRYQKLYSD